MEQTDLRSLENAVWQRKTAFLVVFSVVLALSYAILLIIDFVPEEPAPRDAAEEQNEIDIEQRQTSPTIRNEAVAPDSGAERPAGTQNPGPSNMTAVSALPQTIIIDRLDKVIPVNNPTSRTVADLDEALLSGAVRHPDSATFSNEGTIFILGHSSYLPTVFNKNFQAFNGIEDLKWGDTVRLRSKDTEYVYRVEKVYQAKASEITVPIAGTGPRLTLATCNSFASKDDRYIVESTLVETRPL